MTLQSSITLLGILVIGIVVVAFFVIQRQTTKLIEPINRWIWHIRCAMWSMRNCGLCW